MKKILSIILIVACFTACNTTKMKENSFNYKVDTFADLEILRYQVEGFDKLSLTQKEYIYYLSQAAIEGRDILFDQNYKHNLLIRRTLEAVYENYKGNRNFKDFKHFETYLKKVWFSNGIHHHYSMVKFIPDFSVDYFSSLVRATDAKYLPLKENQTVNDLLTFLTPIIFDPKVDAVRVNLRDGEDVIATSANNYYEGVTQKEVETFYAKSKDLTDPRPISFGLNSKLTKKDGQLIEETWKVGGMYSPAIERIVAWLEKSKAVAENDKQKKIIDSLISFYQTGSLKTFDEYSILWVGDTESQIDFVNGFIESYGDALGLKGSWESLVNFKNIEATKRTQIISSNAQWFENNSPIDSRFKKEKVKGVSAKVIMAAMLGGDCYPATPIGINLPNANWIRSEYGSKSVTIENITEAYDKASKGNGFLEEFVWSEKERKLMEQYAFTTDNLHTDLHECLGHGSGKLLPGVDQDALKAYGAAIEEARADLFGLYYMGDKKIVELGLLPNKEAYKAEYYKFMMNGLLTQLVRIQLGDNIQEAHMRNRQLIAKWVFEKGQKENVVELKKRYGKTYVVINDYVQLRQLFGQLLAEIQRVKSEGDYEGAKNLIEKYAIKIDLSLHQEIKSRYEKLNLAPYKGFVNPVYTPVLDGNGQIKDVKVSYNETYVEQMMRYSKQFSILPTNNN
jgi:dipeptidyl-peptidase-3